jgi:hypothetical protein
MLISKILDNSFYTGIKQDPDLRLYRSACIDGRVRYWVYYTKEALANSPEVKSIVEKAKRTCTIDDSDDIAPEIDPFNSDPGPRNYRPPNRNVCTIVATYIAVKCCNTEIIYLPLASWKTRSTEKVSITRGQHGVIADSCN